MADNSLVALTDSDTEVQAPQSQEGTTVPSVSPNRDIPEPLFYSSGEARVIRTRRRGAGSSRADPYSNYTGNPTIRMFRPPLARRWDWLPITLNTWRSEEEIQVPADPMDISPYTQEPIHHTVPVLAARLHRHEQRLEDLEREQHTMTTYLLRQAHDRMAQLQRDCEEMNHTLDMVHQQVIDDRGVSDLLQARLEECEQRSQEAEEYTRVLEQRLTLAEDSARQTSRLAETINRLVTLMSRVNLRD